MFPFGIFLISIYYFPFKNIKEQSTNITIAYKGARLFRKNKNLSIKIRGLAIIHNTSKPKIRVGEILRESYTIKFCPSNDKMSDTMS